MARSGFWVGACAILLAAPLAIVTVAGSPAQARPGGSMASGARSASTARTDAGEGGSAPTVNWALSGTATATTTESGSGSTRRPATTT
jgi:hypothetical protein